MQLEASGVIVSIAFVGPPRHFGWKASKRASMSDSLIGVTLKNRYEIIRQLGSGGFGDTYLALDRDLPDSPKRVVKHLAPKQLALQDFYLAQRLFNQEAKLLCKLGEQHEQIPLLYAYFGEDEKFYLVQEYIEGHDLTQEILPGQKLSEEETLDLLKEILSILSFVHDNGVIHRDIKPQNIMRRERDGKLFLIDFGAVKEISVMQVDSQGQTSLTLGIGSPGFMPNEQANGRPKLSSDIYAVGMIGVNCLTGIPPSQLGEDRQTGEAQWRQYAQVSEETAQFIQTMIRDHFSQRFATAKIARDALNSLPQRLNRDQQILPRIELMPLPIQDELQPSPSIVNKANRDEFQPLLSLTRSLKKLKSIDAVPTRSRRSFLVLLSLGGFGLSGAVLWGLAQGRTRTIKFGSSSEEGPVSTKSSLPPKGASFLSLPNKTVSFETVRVNESGEVVEKQDANAEIYQEDLGAGVTLDMVLIPSGTFIMGSPDSELERRANEGPQHEVTVPAFAIGQYPVTQAQWKAVMGNNPSTHLGDRRPVNNISWNEAADYCHKLSLQTGRDYRLPSEAEWEYACRAGTATPFHFGETITSNLANIRSLESYASAPIGDYRRQTTDVGLFPPNAFGLYDMHGNVWELCSDHWHDNYIGAPKDGSAWVTGGKSASRIPRGGSFVSEPGFCRSAYRVAFSVDFKTHPLGFRLALSL